MEYTELELNKFSNYNGIVDFAKKYKLVDTIKINKYNYEYFNRLHNAFNERLNVFINRSLKLIEISLFTENKPRFYKVESNMATERDFIMRYLSFLGFHIDYYLKSIK